MDSMWFYINREDREIQRKNAHIEWFYELKEHIKRQLQLLVSSEYEVVIYRNYTDDISKNWPKKWDIFLRHKNKKQIDNFWGFVILLEQGYILINKEYKLYDYNF